MAVLFCPEKVSRAAQLEVQRRQPEARSQIGKFLERGQAPPGDGRQSILRADQEIRVGAAVRTSHPAAKLVKIGEAERVCVIDDDGIGARDVEAIFDQRRRHQNVVFPTMNFSMACSRSFSPIWP